MDYKISNRIIFNIYAWTNFTLLIIFIIIQVVLLLAYKTANKELVHNVIIVSVILVFTTLIIRIFDYLIKPAYFEATISFGHIHIKSFNQIKNHGFDFLRMLVYRKYLIEHKLDRQSFTSYRINIEFSGFKKSLILQKIENGKLFESGPINISFLGARKYTDLILSIDRLKEKISMN
jgi:hypothetical protein